MPLLTNDPTALRILMDEPLFLVAEGPGAVQIPAEKVDTPAEPQPTLEPGFTYAGGNGRFLLLLVNEAGHEHASPETLTTLERLLAGLRLGIDDVAILNISRYPVASFDALRSFFACSKTVLFGIDPGTLGITGIASNEITDAGGVRMLATFSFAEMSLNEQKKRAFWGEMKKL